MTHAPKAPGDGVAPSGPPPEAPPPTRRTRVAILLSFLGAFLLLVVIFRAVLFPFLIAIFIAYLIEPVVAAFTRAPVFGVRWTRGPTIVLMYAVVLTGIALTASCAISRAASTVRDVSRDVNKVLAERGEAAQFELVGLEPGHEAELEQDVRVPAGTQVVLVPHGPVPPPAGPAPAAPPAPAEPGAAGPPAVFETYHDALIHVGERGVRIILKPVEGPVPAGRRPGDVLNPEGIRYQDGSPLPPGLRVEPRPTAGARGLEIWIERTLLGPIVKNLAAVGYQAEPTTLREFIADQADGVGGHLKSIVARGPDLALRVGKSLYLFLLILMLTAFIVMDRKRISAFFASLPPDHLKPEYASLIRYVDQGLAGVIRGQLVICAVNGVLTWIGLVLLGVRGAALLSLVAGVLSLIPIFGTIVSSIPIVLVATTTSIGTGVLSLAWIGFIHLLEANLLNPMIMGSHANMHPVVIVFALLAGEHAFGAWGALLAVPTMSILQSCFLFYRHEIEGIPRHPPEPHGEWLRNLLRRLFGRRGASTPPAPPPA